MQFDVWAFTLNPWVWGLIGFTLIFGMLLEAKMQREDAENIAMLTGMAVVFLAMVVVIGSVIWGLVTA